MALLETFAGIFVGGIAGGIFAFGLKLGSASSNGPPFSKAIFEFVGEAIILGVLIGMVIGGIVAAWLLQRKNEGYETWPRSEKGFDVVQQIDPADREHPS